MKKRFEHLPALSRGQRTLRNLLLTALAAVTVWGCLDFYISDPELSFRRAERANWVGPAQYRGSVETAYDRWGLGTVEDWVILHQSDYGDLEYWPRAVEGVTLCPIPEVRLELGTSWIAAADPPERTASARLDITLSCYYADNPSGGRQRAATLEPPGGWYYGEPEYWEKRCQLEGIPMAGGDGFAFCLAVEDLERATVERSAVSDVSERDIFRRGPDYRWVNVDMEAVFYDAKGTELGRGSLRTPD